VFGGGGFRNSKGKLPSGIDFSTDLEELDKIAKDLLIDGEARAEIVISADNIDVKRLDVENENRREERVIDFKYRESSFMEDSSSPLERATINYDTQKQLEEAVIQSPELAQNLPHIQSAELSLGLPSFLLDQSSIDRATIEQIYPALWYFPLEGQPIRHLIRARISDEAYPHLLEFHEEAVVVWDWNYHYDERESYCRFGAAYQVFKRFNLDLQKLREYERDLLNQLVRAGLGPKSWRDDCEKSYEAIP